MEPIERLEDLLGVRLNDRSLLEQALTHRSYAFERGDDLEPNERLEFLGDAVLGLGVTTLLYRDFPDEQEGRLAKLRAAAVKAGALARVGRELRLGEHVRLGKGEAASGGADKDSILADTFEAVIGALYLDQGYDVVEELLTRLFRPRLRGLAGKGPALDYKTSLQELVAARYESVPVYELVDDGPDHEKHFIATVVVDGVVRGRGSGGSKKKAEQAAAREAYRRLSEERPAGRSEEAEGARAP